MENSLTGREDLDLPNTGAMVLPICRGHRCHNRHFTFLTSVRAGFRWLPSLDIGAI